MTALPAAAAPGDAGVVINEAYLSGGSANAVYSSKFVELYNPTDAPVDLSGYSLQYRSATGDENSHGTVVLTGEIAADGYYLVRMNGNGENGSALDGADLDAGGAVNPSGTRGTLALVDGIETVALSVGSIVAADGVIDLLGYGTSNTFETAAATAPDGNSDPRSFTRTNFADTDNNAADFTLSTDVTPESSTGVAPEEPTDPEEPQEPENPGEPATVEIAEIQGTGDASPLADQTVTTTGVVTAAYPTGGFDGYYLQTPGSGTIDETHTASDAIFVYSPDTVASVSVGQYVEVTGEAGEYFGMTQLSVSGIENVTQLDPATITPPAPAEVEFPATDEAREVLEGMLLAPAGDYTVTNTYTTNQYAEIPLAASSTPLVTPTVLGEPGSPEHDAATARIAAELVTLDDGSSTNFFPRGGGDNQDIPLPYLTPDAPVRVGAAVTFIAPVVLDYRFDAWKLQPTSQLTAENANTVQPATFENTREASPRDVGGDVTLATFNVLNYFPTTGDERTGCTFYTDRDGNPVTVENSDAEGCGVRGAADAENLERQQAKIVAAINALDADIVSLEEIENSAAVGKDRDFAVSALVDALNEDAGSDVWEYAASPSEVPANEDVIRTAFIYKPAAVETVGDGQILIGSNAFSNARQPNAQAFMPAGGDESETFVVIANHFKSKGSRGATGDNVDAGQGAYNGDRTRQAEALVAFADEVAADHGTERVFLVGDFNSYAAEDPIDVLRAAGYVDQGAKTGEYTYSFDGAVGSLDYIFASAAADSRVGSADVWNINSGESIALEYSRHNYNATDFYAPDPFRSSDHDPVLVGIDLSPTTTTLNLLNINDFHGRIDENTVAFAGTVEQLKNQHLGTSLFLSAGDNIGASVFASSTQQDQPTIDVLNALSLRASAAGNHEFDNGYLDLINRVSDESEFPYLAANVTLAGEPMLDGYTLIDVDGVTVAVIGAVTQETPTLVSPDGIEGVEFGDPVDAVNRVAGLLSDGEASNGEADVIVAEYHEGAGAGTPDGATLDDEIAAGGAFADIVTLTSPEVDVIFTGHTHKQYAWEAPVPGASGQTRPVLQTGSYGEYVGQVVLEFNAQTGDVSTVSLANVPRLTTADGVLVERYPAVRQVQAIVQDALAHADEVGGEVIGSAAADITTAFANGERDDRSSESTLGNFVADSLVASLGSAERGGAEIGVVNPGGLRADITAGDITYAEANAVLPFLNNLWTTTLTGEQFKTVLEQQWQRTAEGEVPSRPYLQLGLSSNVSYTYDPAREEGDRVTSITVNDEPIDPEREYRIGSFSFLLQGGDNFHELAQGTDTRDSGLVDRDAWIDYLSANSPVSPSFERRAVQVTGLPDGPVVEGDEISLQFAKLDLTSLGAPANTQLAASVDGQQVATAPVANGESTLSFTVPAGAEPDAFAAALATWSSTLTVIAEASGTTVSVPIDVTSAEAPTAPGDGSPGAGGNDDSGTAGQGPLPETGAEAAPQMLLALMLIMAGVGSALVARRIRATRRS